MRRKIELAPGKHNFTIPGETRRESKLFMAAQWGGGLTISIEGGREIKLQHVSFPTCEDEPYTFTFTAIVPCANGSSGNRVTCTYVDELDARKSKGILIVPESRA